MWLCNYLPPKKSLHTHLWRQLNLGRQNNAGSLGKRVASLDPDAVDVSPPTHDACTMPGRRSAKSESRLLADELALSRGHSTGAIAPVSTRRVTRASARDAITRGGLRANPFDLLQLDAADEDESAVVDNLEGCVEVETDAFDDLPPAERLRVPAPLTSLDWATESPRSFSYRGTTKTLPRFASCAARAFPVYQMCAKRWLDPMTKQQLQARGATALAKMLRPLSAACNAQIFGAYQHGLITREQACSKKPADMYFVMKVLGSLSFARQHLADTEHAAMACVSAGDPGTLPFLLL